MAEETDAHSKTEDATPRRLEEARRKGDVAKTPDLPQWMSLAAAVSVLTICGGWMARDIMEAMIPFVAHPEAVQLEGGGAVEVLRKCMMAAAPALLILLSATALAGVAGNLVQHGFLWSPDKLKPDFSKVSPMKGFKRLYGADGLMQFIKSLLKLSAIAVICWISLRDHWATFLDLVRMEPQAMLPFSVAILKAMAFSVVGALGVSAAVDWFWQRHRFLQRMRMSREELKEEMKQSEGDPHIRARLKQIRMERSRRRMIQAVPRATVVVTNPTHYAVALFYEPGEAPVPQCLAKGTDKVALRIRDAAQAAGVPIVENPPLARALYATVDVDEAIPQQHYEAVAKVIGFVLNSARKKAHASWL